MASVNEKSRTLNLLYKMTNALYGQKVRIERDPLHCRYEVNRYGIYLESKTRSSAKMPLISTWKPRPSGRGGKVAA
jgi:hypothetical protein